MMGYLKQTISNTDMVSLIGEVVKNPRPFLLTRFGDGEIWILNEEITTHRMTSMGKCGLKFNGLAEYKKINDSLKLDLELCLKESDVIGLLDPKQEHGTKLVYREHVWSIPLKTVNQVRDNEEFVVCDHQIFRSRHLGDPLKARKIFSGTSINIISSNSDKLIKNDIAGLLDCNVTYTNIRYSNSFGNISNTPNVLNELYYNKEDVIKRLDSIKEDIVLFGTSGIGKFVGPYLKKMGKVVLDYGSTLDGWSGKPTRVWFNSTQSHCLIKK